MNISYNYEDSEGDYSYGLWRCLLYKENITKITKILEKVDNHWSSR